MTHLLVYSHYKAVSVQETSTETFQLILTSRSKAHQLKAVSLQEINFLLLITKSKTYLLVVVQFAALPLALSWQVMRSKAHL